MNQKTKSTKCPECKKTFSYYTSEFRPFCCERCKMIDLSKWLNEDYKISTEAVINEEHLTIPNDDENVE